MTNEELETLSYDINDLIDVIYNAPDDVAEYVISAIVNGESIDTDEFIHLFGEPEDSEDEEEE